MKQKLNVAALGALAGGVLVALLEGAAGLNAQPQSTNPFRTARIAAPSVARADTLACTKLTTARAVAPASLDIAQFARALTGTWVRELTWYGQLVVNESAMYFNVDPQSGKLTGMMYDQSNMGRGPMYSKLEELRTSPDRARAATTMTFLDCDFGIVDKYYKISDTAEFAFGDRLANLSADRNQPLKDVFDKMTSAGFFRMNPQEILRRPTRLVARDKIIDEQLTPSVGGAFWEGALTSTQARGPVGLPRETRGVALRMAGTYRGAHVGSADAGASVEFKGNESAIFFKEGDAFVAATARQRSLRTPRAGLDALANGGWSTDCADFFGFGEAIIWERVVLSGM
jgi:hypothetical protein